MKICFTLLLGPYWAIGRVYSKFMDLMLVQ